MKVDDNDDAGDSGEVERDRRQARHEQEWELFQLLEQVPVGIFVVTAAGKPYYANHQARRLLFNGLVAEHVSRFSEVYGAYEIGTERLYPSMRFPLVRALSGERCEVSDIEIRSVDGRVTPLHVSAAPVRIGGELAFGVAALQDVRELRRIATRDALTGLPNRSAAVEAFNGERMLAERTGRPTAIAVIDFDRFKSINDTYGHAAGDEVLRRASAAIVETLRATDVVTRWGGEELLVVMPNTDRASAAAALERALVAVRTLELDRELRITFSAGVAGVESGESLDEVVARADAALYEAKRGGRDRVVTA